MIRLETERLVLRDYVQEDLDDYYRLKSDPDVMRYMQGSRAVSRDEVKRQLDEILQDASSPERHFYFFHMETKEGDPVGSIGYTVLSHQSDGVVCGGGYFLFPLFWGRGYATEAFRKVLEFAFLEGDASRMEASCVRQNRASERVMQKCGMRLECSEKEARLKYGLARQRALSIYDQRYISLK